MLYWQNIRDISPLNQDFLTWRSRKVLKGSKVSPVLHSYTGIYKLYWNVLRVRRLEKVKNTDVKSKKL